MSENLICECAECVSARRWIADKTGLGGGPRPLAFLIASHEQHERELAAAEERGRRAGIEERDLYRRLLLDFLCGHGPSECAGKGECFCDEVWPLFDIPHGRVDVARYRFKSLAPRDSGKEPAKMDAPGGPRCWCGRLSVSESGWCGGCESPTEPA